MRLTRQTNYAVRILMYCAANTGQLSRTSDIAKAYSVSELFLFKILQPLTKAGLVETVVPCLGVRPYPLMPRGWHVRLEQRLERREGRVDA